MSAKLIVLAGGSASIQGLGFYGSQRYGIAPGGAMDRWALAEANGIVNRSPAAAAFEIGPLPFRFRVTDAAVRLAFAGADRGVTIDGERLPAGQSRFVPAGSVVTLSGSSQGQFSYLAFDGGIIGCSRQNSDSKASFEHVRSWALQNGDRIEVGVASVGQAERRLRLANRGAAPIRVVLGPQLDYFTAEEVRHFLSTSWSVSHAANRMAYLLDGSRIRASKGHNIVSDGTVTGNIQIAGSGQPFVIMCDRGTVGGYPKIATIITADLGRFAQMSRGTRFHFQSVSVMEAQVVAREFAEQLARLRSHAKALSSGGVELGALYEQNIAGEAFDAVAWTHTSLAPPRIERDLST